MSSNDTTVSQAGANSIRRPLARCVGHWLAALRAWASNMDQSLAENVRELQAQAYLGVAGFCLLLYDILMTWDIEVTLVWPAPFSFVKALFLWNRYVTPSVYIWVVYMFSGQMTSVPSDSYCFAFFLCSLLLQALCTNFVCATLMLIRVWALYNCDRRVLALLGTLLGLQLALSIAVPVYACLYEREQMSFVQLFRTCILTTHLRWLWVVFLFMIFFDIVVFILLLWKTWEHVRLTEGHWQTSLMGTLLVDGVWYFLVVLTTEVVNVVSLATFSSDLFMVGLNIGWCLTTMMISRIYLNLRKTASPQDWGELTAFKTSAPSQVVGRTRYHSTRFGAGNQEDSVDGDDQF